MHRASFFDAIDYYWFVMRWLWKNRTWADTRQKYKAMNQDYEQYKSKKKARR